MPVTFKVSPRNAIPTDKYKGPETVASFLDSANYSHSKEIGEILQSSADRDTLTALSPCKNGFVQAIIRAYAHHLHLILRPDDVWIAILTQLNFYINAHAEELRRYFVLHEGQREICLCYGRNTTRTRYNVDFAWMARECSKQLDKELVDKTFVEWALPDFTTTTDLDTTICSTILMATLQKYFNYHIYFTCGIQSVTLLGEKADWLRLLARLDRLPQLGDEPAQWAQMLRPILSRFAAAFDGNPDLAFWSQVVHQGGACGTDYISGWVSAFCVWDGDGNWLVSSRNDNGYTLDGVSYFTFDNTRVPAGFSAVDVSIYDFGRKYPCKMLAGHVAVALTPSGGDGNAQLEGERVDSDGEVVYDTIRPAPQWFMYMKKP